jgi:hypothetical protein
MKTEELATQLAASRTDLRRYLDAARRSNRPYVVVASDAVKAWERREPESWAMFEQWLTANGKSLVQV